MSDNDVSFSISKDVQRTRKGASRKAIWEVNTVSNKLESCRSIQSKALLEVIQIAHNEKKESEKRCTHDIRKNIPKEVVKTTIKKLKSEWR